MYSPITGTGSGAAPVVDLTWPFIDQTHVKASVGGVDVPYTWTGSLQITFSAAVPSGATWKVYRQTERDSNLVTYADGAVLTQADLNLADTQRLYIEQELASDVDAATAEMASSSSTDAYLSSRIDALEQVGSPLTAVAPRPLQYGSRAPLRTIRKARERLTGTNGSSALHLDIVGYAAHPNSGGPGITGGYGLAQYYVDDPSWDSTVPNTFGWALASAKAAGGGQIYFDPRGKFDIVVTDNVQFRLNEGEDNMTFYAPGRNVTVWTTSLSGSIVIKGANLLFDGIVFRTLAGPASGDWDGTGIKAEVGLVSVFPQNIDKLAFNHCEFRRASDGALDIASTGFTAANPEANVTIQNSIFWDTDEVSLFGSISDTSTVADARKLFVTVYNTIWAYSGQRQPKALGLAMVHLVNTYTIMQPWERDQPLPAASPGSAAGAAVQDGGWLLAEGSLWTASVGTGYPATNLVPNPTSGETGNLQIVDSDAENGLIFLTNGTVAAPTTYTLPHDPVPPPGPAREAWVADRWKAAGARPDAAPQGLFVWTSDESAYPNGETVLIERGQTGRWLRVDRPNEYPETPATGASESLFATPRGTTRTVGFVGGKTSGAALGTSTLDIVGLDSSYFVAQGNGAAANVKFLMSSGGWSLADGTHLYLSGSSSAPITLKTTTKINATGVETGGVSNSVTVPAHGMTTGDWPIYFTTTGTMPAGLVSKQPYYAVVVDANTLKLALTYDDAVSGVAGSVVEITDVGSGTLTANIGNLNLPNGADMVLNSSAVAVHLVYDALNVRFEFVSQDVSSKFDKTGGTITGGVTLQPSDAAAYPTITFNHPDGSVGGSILASPFGLAITSNSSNTLILQTPVGAVAVLDDTGVHVQASHGLYLNNGEIMSGTYTPTLTPIANVSAAVMATGAVGFYTRIGNIVTVYVAINVTATAAASTDTQVKVSLPVASTLAVAFDVVGRGAEDSSSATVGGTIKASGTDALYRFAANSTSALNHYLSFSYRVL